MTCIWIDITHRQIFSFCILFFRPLHHGRNRNILCDLLDGTLLILFFLMWL